MIFCGIFFFHPSLVTDIRRYRQERINSRQNKINSRQNKINSRLNKINSRQNKRNSRQNKEKELVSGKSTANHAQRLTAHSNMADNEIVLSCDFRKGKVISFAQAPTTGKQIWCFGFLIRQS